MYKIIINLFFTFLFLCIFSSNQFYIKTSLHIALFFTIKFILDFTNALFGFIECKIRNVDRNKGYINNLCSTFYNTLNTWSYYIYFIKYIYYNSVF